VIDSVSGIVMVWGPNRLVQVPTYLSFSPFPNIIGVSATKEICRNMNIIYELMNLKLGAIL